MAQPDNAADSDSEDRGFESLRAGQKKEVTFVYQKLLLFLSKPQAWYIITARSAVHIISPFRAVYHHASVCILLRLDEMQHCVRDAGFARDARLRRVCGTHRITYHSKAASLITYLQNNLICGII